MGLDQYLYRIIKLTDEDKKQIEDSIDICDYRDCLSSEYSVFFKDELEDLKSIKDYLYKTQVYVTEYNIEKIFRSKYSDKEYEYNGISSYVGNKDGWTVTFSFYANGEGLGS